MQLTQAPVQLYTVAFGAKYRDWFKRALLPSLLFPKNREALTKARWHIVTDDFQDLAFVARLFPGTTYFSYPSEKPEAHLLQQLIECLHTNYPFLMAPPDTVFSNGAIPSLIQAGANRRTVVGMVHVRVNPSFLEPPLPFMTGAQLVSRAWKHLHASWQWAKVSKAPNSFVGGVSWKFISEHLIAVQHRLPTPYLVNISPSDIEYFSHEQFSAWDHEWPTKLVNEQRWRYIASSDAAFAVEITDEHSNCAAPHWLDGGPPDEFGRDLEHNKLNRQVVAILRSEDKLL